MKRNRMHLLIAGFLVLPLASLIAQTAPIAAEARGMKLSILIKGDTAEVTVEAPVTGWVAVGFNPSSRMKDADFLIGYVKDGVAYARDDFGVSNTSHADDTKVGGTADIISFRGTEKDGVTTMTFVIPVASKDPKDVKLTSGAHTVILGASGADNFTGMHSRVGKASITIP